MVRDLQSYFHVRILYVSCLKQLVRGSQVDGPESRKSHTVPNEGVEIFSTNRYVLDYIELMNQKPKTDEGVYCEEHGKPGMMFCLDLQCSQVLCPFCLIQDHSNCPIQDYSNYKRIGVMENVHESVDFNQLCQDTGSIQVYLQSYGEQVKTAMNTISKEGHEAQKAIDSKVDSIIQSILQEAESMKGKIQRQEQQEKEKFEDIQAHITSCASIGDQIMADIDITPNSTASHSLSTISNILKTFVEYKNKSKGIRSIPIICQTVHFEENQQTPLNPIGNLVTNSTTYTVEDVEKQAEACAAADSSDHTAASNVGEEPSEATATNQPSDSSEYSHSSDSSESSETTMGTTEVLESNSATTVASKLPLFR